MEIHIYDGMGYCIPRSVCGILCVEGCRVVFLMYSWNGYDSMGFFLNLCSVYVEMADLLREFTDPAVMDIKMGVR